MGCGRVEANIYHSNDLWHGGLSGCSYYSVCIALFLFAGVGGVDQHLLEKQWHLEESRSRLVFVFKFNIAFL